MASKSVAAKPKKVKELVVPRSKWCRGHLRYKSKMDVLGHYLVALGYPPEQLNNLQSCCDVPDITQYAPKLVDVSKLGDPSWDSPAAADIQTINDERRHPTRETELIALFKKHLKVKLSFVD